MPKNITIDNENNEFQSCWIEIINDPNPNILTGCYYRRPGKSSNDVFPEKLRQIVNKNKRSNKYIIICGDFNYNLLHHKHNEYVNEFVNIMYPNFLHPCITEPTRLIRKQKPSLIDNVFVHFFNKKKISGNLFYKIPDHLPNFVFIKDINNKETKIKFKIRDMKNFNQDKYLEDLKEIENLNLLQYKNVNVMFNVYQDKLIDIVLLKEFYQGKSKN